MDSPSENTTVFRMKQEFNKFLAGSSAATRRTEGKRLTFTDSLLDNSANAGSSYLQSSHRGNTTREVSISAEELQAREKEDKQRQVELITAKSKITQLESQLSSLETSRKRARIEYEHALESKEFKFKSEIDKIADLKHQLRLLSEREEDTKSKLNDTRRDFEAYKAEHETKYLTLQKEKLEQQDYFADKEFDFQDKIASLEQTVASLRNDIQSSSSNHYAVKEQLDIAKRQQAESVTLRQRLEEKADEISRKNIQIKDLELQLSKYESDASATKAMKSELVRLQFIEKENRRLHEENRYNRETKENILLLREQNESLHKKLERAEERVQRFVKLQVEHEELQKKLSRWEVLDGDGVSRPRSPSAITKRVSDLQAANAALLEKQGTLLTSAHALEENLRARNQEVQSLTTKIATGDAKTAQQTDLIKRLQRKLLLVSKERDGYKGIIDSYESEVTVNVTDSSASRIRQLEETVESCQKHIDALEAELSLTADKMAASRAEHQLMEQRLGTIISRGPDDMPHVTSDADQKIIQGLRDQIASLEKTLEESQRERDILEERIERRHLQGDYDPSRTKVVHFSMNPVALAQKRQTEELARLKTENEKLKKRLEVLEEGGAGAQDVTIQVETRMQQSTSQDVEEIKSQLVSAELKNKRLTEAFKKTSKEFREVCYQLLGYRIDMKSNNQYKLMNMYADTPDDFLLFQQSPDGAMQMLGTDYSSTLQEKIEHYLQNGDSIPAFLCSITMDLFSQQTMMS